MRVFLVAIVIFISLSVKAERLANAVSIEKQRKKQSTLTNDLFKSYLEISSFRNKILSQNVANINTPGYKADEVAMPESLNDLAPTNRSVKKIRMFITSDRHIVNKNREDSKFASHKLKNPDEIKKNGNNVSLRQQMTKISQNKNDYATAVKSYAVTNSLFSSVIGK
ncbi:MAG: flagellar basal body rod protein FlgB [Rickettsiaceae bacterium]